MENNEYVIINKTAIQQRIDELGEITLKTSNEDNRGFTQEVWNDLIDDSILSSEYKILNQILSQSTPLIPVLEDAFDAGQFEEYKNISFDGGENYETVRIIKEKEDYISNLKLDIWHL